MWLRFHVADSQLSIQRPIPWVTQSQWTERTCKYNPGRRLHPHKYPVSSPCTFREPRAKAINNYWCCWGCTPGDGWEGSDFSADRNNGRRDCDTESWGIVWICKKEAKNMNVKEECRGTVTFDVTENRWWKEVKMWLDCTISSGKCRYLICFASPSPNPFSL